MQLQTRFEPDEPIDFAEIASGSVSVTLPAPRIKRPSKILPPPHYTTRRSAFHAGVKQGTGAANFYKFGTKMRQLLGLLPGSEHGRVADALDEARNEARTLVADVQQQIKTLEAGKSTLKERLRALYVLERSLARLGPATRRVRELLGLLRGAATVGLTGYLSPCKSGDARFLQHARTRKRLGAAQGELALLEAAVARGEAVLAAAARAARVPARGRALWQAQNGPRLEAALNTARGAGNMVGVAVQGAITSGIYVAIGAALLNPAVLAAGAYFFVTAWVRVGGISGRTLLENAHIRRGAPVEAHLRRIETLEKAHLTMDAMMSKTVFQVTIAYVSIPAGLLSSLDPGLVFYHSSNLVPAFHYDNPTAFK